MSFNWGLNNTLIMKSKLVLLICFYFFVVPAFPLTGLSFNDTIISDAFDINDFTDGTSRTLASGARPNSRNVTGTTFFIPLVLARNTYIDSMTRNSAVATQKAAPLTGNVAQPTITLIGTTTLFTYAQGQGPSVHQTISVSGINLEDNLTISVPNSNWEISTNAAFSTSSSSIILNKNALNSVSSTAIHIRLKTGLLQGQYEFLTDNDFEVSSTNATTKSVDLDGEVSTAVAFINVEGNVGLFPDITAVTNTPISLNNTLFAQRTVGNSQTKSYRIQNLGGFPLNVSSITIIGANPLDFTVTNPPIFPLVLPPGSLVTFEVTFNPTSTGQRDAIVSINNNSDNISPSFDFNIRGTGNNAEIGITGNGNDIPNGNTAINATDFTLIGVANANAANPTTISKAFLISNTGNIELHISGIAITGTDASQFSVNPLTQNITDGTGGMITVAFAPTSTGTKNATISIFNNDATDNENPFTFAVQGHASGFVACAPETVGPLEIIAIQDFETPATTPVWPYTYVNGTIDGGTAIAVVSGSNTTVNTFIGTKSFQVPNGKGILNFNFDTSNYQEVELNFRLGSFSLINANGADAGDNVKVSISTDGISFIDEILIKGNSSNVKWGFGATGAVFSVNNNVLEEFASSTGDAGISNVTLTNLPISSNLYVRITTLNNDTDEIWAIDNVILKGKIATGISEKTWSGTNWSGDGLPPTSSQKVIIDGNLTLPYTIDATTYTELEACECQINSGKKLIIGNNFGTTPAVLVSQGAITNGGEITINNNSSLVQVNDDVINTGNISVTRIAKASQYDYIYWSSPVADFPINSIPNSHRYEWDTKILNPKGTEGNWVNPTTADMTKGKGYIVRASNGKSIPEDLSVTFTGIPFNGTFTFPISRGSTAGTNDCWNLIGNPYPSAIDADLFLDDNPNIEGSVRIWTHGTPPKADNDQPFYQDFTYNYSEDDYIIYNGTAVLPPHGFDGQIASGQGFFIRMLEDGETDVLPPTSTEIAAISSITFKNAYRRANDDSMLDNSQFYKNSSANKNREKSRIWLDLIASNNQISKTVIGYVIGATLAKDRLYDALIEVESFKIYSLINALKQAIQGRPVPFDNNDLVPLGIFIEKEGVYKIAISAADGLFSNNSQSIYLEDKLLNIIHDLRNLPYQFSSGKGIFNERFVLRYTNEFLTNEEFVKSNQLVITINHSQITIASKAEVITKIQIFDMLGRKIYNKKDVNSNIYSISNLVKNQVLIVKARLVNGEEISNKIVVK